jgi:hypothetical protein
MQMRATLAVMFMLPAASAAQETATGIPGWQFVTEGGFAGTPAQLDVMPPGWHITTTAGGLWWDTTWAGHGSYAVEMEVFLFPEPASSDYGIFIGGRTLGSPGMAYQSFQVSPAGAFDVESRSGGEMKNHLAGEVHAAVVKQGATSPVKNVLRVEVRPAAVGFSVNGTELYRGPGSGAVDGVAGLRLGAGINLHVSRFTVQPLQ